MLILFFDMWKRQVYEYTNLGISGDLHQWRLLSTHASKHLNWLLCDDSNLLWSCASRRPSSFNSISNSLSLSLSPTSGSSYCLDLLPVLWLNLRPDYMFLMFHWVKGKTCAFYKHQQGSSFIGFDDFWRDFSLLMNEKDRTHTMIALAHVTSLNSLLYSFSLQLDLNVVGSKFFSLSLIICLTLSQFPPTRVLKNCFSRTVK